MTADLATEDGAQAVLDAAMQAHGRIDILVTAAGIGATYDQQRPGSMADTAKIPPDAWHEVLALNVDVLERAAAGARKGRPPARDPARRGGPRPGGSARPHRGRRGG